MEELALKIDTLTQLYTQIESHLSDSITWFLTVFFGAITVIVLALVFLVKTSIQRGVDKASNGLDEKLDKLQGQIDESIQKQKAFDCSSSRYSSDFSQHRSFKAASTAFSASGSLLSVYSSMVMRLMT